MKLWILSDTHFGKYSVDSDRWLNNMRSYFWDFFIPILKEKAKPRDKFIFLGDLFDNRTSIDMRAITLAVELFEELSKIIECHVLLGNHDQRMMTDPTINSVATIRNISNVYVYNKPKLLNFDELSVLMMPWVHGKDSEKDILEKYSGTDLLFCHSDLNGCRTQLYPTRPVSRNILDIEDFSGFGKVYSGHIHIVQEINNFTFVGSPYHLDRNDVDNRKGIWIYDTKKRLDVFLENDFSPEFKKIRIYEEPDLELLRNEVNTNNFIDIEISNNLLLNQPHVRLELDKIVNKNTIENIEFINDIEVEETKRKVYETKNKSIKDISFDWCDNIKINQETDLFTEIEFRSKLKNTIEDCFNLLEINKK